MNLQAKLMSKAATLVGAVLLLSAVPLKSADATISIAPPGSSPFGTSYARWGAAWWQWVFSLHYNNPLHPLMTTGDVDCSYGQQGQVWFLVGSLEAKTITRNCKVPLG